MRRIGREAGLASVEQFSAFNTRSLLRGIGFKPRYAKPTMTTLGPSIANTVSQKLFQIYLMHGWTVKSTTIHVEDFAIFCIS